MTKLLNKKAVILTVIFLIALTKIWGCGPSNKSNSTEENVPQQLPPPAPFLTVSPVSISQIHLEWSSSGLIAGFKLERSPSLIDGYVQIAVLGANVSSYEDTGLVDNTAYYYRIRAYNYTGDSPYSNSAGTKTNLAGFSLCVARANLGAFHCIYPECDKTLDNSTYLTATGTEVFNCLGLGLVFNVPVTMTVNFSYHAEAGSCFGQPYFEVKVGTTVQDFYFDCNATGTSSISITIASGQSINDISFGLFTGDWAAAVNIHDVTLTP
ncbi:MAG: fibronectin type III domain-containing protein [Candidatus Parcubacteria bacterium]|nr:fibronectin type III domain-containing protein [Candidatus Parcubacteria bacterium]